MSNNNEVNLHAVSDEPELVPAEEMPTCTRVIDMARKRICGKPGYEEVWVRNAFGMFAACLCYECRVDHIRFYEKLNEERYARKNQRNTGYPNGRTVSVIH